jgi:hypothetical protein
MSDPIGRLIHALDHAVEQAVKQSDTDAVAAQVMTAIQLRTSRGIFLTEGGGTEPRTYKSESHKKKRAKLNLPIDRVTLFMGRVGVLESMAAQSRFNSGEVSITVGYIDGLSEARASEIAGYLDTEGAGKNKVTYPFVGITSAEEDNIVAALAARIGANFNNNFQ